ncbi:MAG: sulfotransferase domain-containing protein [Alphaproteobacteria bacterium]|nr:sulfotransferase domain-containing protein [Alphaproteobacteria bacterium]MBU0796806.1 sulfotransferase domain-containing protein [Alphaproteobacteria bacterium]MBU0885836.1 sulfotransferase domain-containing protein [Alphaproteobacteria bacterium]MBU1812087.1 sulfotransferase domain-containing protein [Alphaproteobacteria bacterium]
MTLTKSNVWLASYPKSGNTWMRIALITLRDGGATIDLGSMINNIGIFLAMRHRLDMALDIDSSDLAPEEVRLLRPKIYGLIDTQARKTTIWKIHDCWERTTDGDAMFPAEATAATIYLVRDPRDVAVSFAHHFEVDMDRAIELMADCNYRVATKIDSSHPHLPQHYSSWSRHVTSWLDQSHLNPLVIRYEDMLVDFADVLRQASATLKWDSTEVAIQRTVSATRFDHLREQERAGNFPEGLRGDRPFFRRGIAGSWRDTLSVAQIARIERDHGEVMCRLGYL